MDAYSTQIRNSCTISTKPYVDSLATVTCISCSTCNASLAYINLKFRLGKTIIFCTGLVDKQKQGDTVLSQRYAEEEWLTDTSVASPIQKHAGGKVGNRRGRHYVALFFLQKAFATELWRGRVEGGRLPNPLTVHQILVMGICMKDRKVHPISKMLRHRSSGQPPPYSLLQVSCSPTPVGPSSY